MLMPTSPSSAGLLSVLMCAPLLHTSAVSSLVSLVSPLLSRLFCLSVVCLSSYPSVCPFLSVCSDVSSNAKHKDEDEMRQEHAIGMGWDGTGWDGTECTPCGRTGRVDGCAHETRFVSRTVCDVAYTSISIHHAMPTMLSCPPYCDIPLYSPPSCSSTSSSSSSSPSSRHKPPLPHSHRSSQDSPLDSHHLDPFRHHHGQQHQHRRRMRGMRLERVMQGC